MKYIKAIIWSARCSLCHHQDMGHHPARGLEYVCQNPRKHHPYRWYCRLPTYFLPHRHPFLNRQIAKEIQ